MQVEVKQDRFTAASLALAGALLFCSAAGAQTGVNSLPDAQIEANVLKALAASPQMSSENITTNTVYGTVTLTGTVKDESTRKLAETLASRADGVKKVVDELTLNTGDSASGAQQGTNPLLQSDGTMAPAPGQPQHAPDPDTYAAQQAQQGNQTPGAGGQMGQQPMQQDPNAVQQPYPQQAQGDPQQGQQSQPYPQQPGYRQPYNGPYPQQQGQSYPPQQQGQGYPQNGASPYPPQQQAQGYPPNGQAPYAQGGYAQAPPPPPYGAQVGGRPVTVPQGAMLRIRINEGLDSKHSQPGSVFDGVVLNDVVADGAVAIPRGASIQGKVTDAHSGGVLSGRGELSLQLTQVTLAGQVFPIVSDVWQRDSGDKSGQTVGNAVGLGVAGALIGAIAGGGGGAAIGAVAGGAAGVGTSAASGGRQVLVPPEAILTFHLAQPAPVATVSQAEMDRLGSGVPTGAQQSQMRRRYPPPPPPGYYGPAYYPRPYPY